MPDISLLQHESYGPEEQQSRLPGIMSTAMLVVFILTIGAYAGFSLYSGVLKSTAANLSQKVTDLKKQKTDVADVVNKVKLLGTEASALKALRTSHATPSQLFAYLEQSTHPVASYSGATINVEKGTVTLQGSISSAGALSRQAEIFDKDKAAGTLVDFDISGVTYGDKHAVKYILTLKLQPDFQLKQTK